MIVELLNRFEPEPEGLLREISKHISDDMLMEIAAADYGQDMEKHLVALRQVRDTGIFPEKMYWCPMEVLELIRWSEPEEPDWKPGRTGEIGHWMRAFSCAAILRAKQEPFNYGGDGGIDSTVIQLIMSLRMLPLDFNIQAMKHLSWQLMCSEPEGRNNQVRIYGVGLLWFALHVVPSVPDKTLISLAKWVVRRADELDWRPTSGGCSGLREMVLNCQKKLSWEIFGCVFCNLDLGARSSDLKVWVNMIGEQLAG
ncbi:MAG: hypothetical protein WAN35_20310 [Terracidiphilus sp.]